MTSNLKDHREIGRELDLFSFHEYAPGAIFWHPNGFTIYRTLQEFLRQITVNEGYQEISTPVMVKSELFRQSGHWEHFGQHNMFNLSVWEKEEVDLVLKAVLKDKRQDIESLIPKSHELFWYSVTIKLKSGFEETVDVQITVTNKEKRSFIPTLPVNYSLKPMNCPESTLVYKAHTRSYKDLPIRLSEFGALHRRELTGVLGGAFRVRQFTIDDAHLFVRSDQIQDEINKLLALVIKVYKSLGFKPKLYLATKPDKAMGDAKTWREAESDLEKALKASKMPFGTKPKDGAFYGPKIDIHIDDSQGRDWQLATIQLDFQIPQRMDLVYVDKDGSKKRPIMIHRGITGSLERFIGILTEHFQGAFPTWLSPIQTIVLPVSDKSLSYAKKVAEKLGADSVRVEVDNRKETLQAKIRDATLQKIPYLLVVGEKEQKEQSVAARTREGKDLGQIKLDAFVAKITDDIEKKS